ncbi:hypothetical protein BDW75DRAFT_231609 [Aspergillus navahoensis]
MTNHRVTVDQSDSQDGQRCETPSPQAQGLPPEDLSDVQLSRKWQVLNPLHKAELAVAFPQVDWDLLQIACRWISLQYQAWTRGYMYCTCAVQITKQPQHVTIDERSLSLSEATSWKCGKHLGLDQHAECMWHWNQTFTARFADRPLPEVRRICLEADNMEVRRTMDAAYGICAWILFSKRCHSWGGDTSVGNSGWSRAIGWSGPEIMVDDWMVIGHSNGGQTVWFLTTHYPDNVFATGPASGYTSIESIPTLQYIGLQDTNIPVYHSHLMHTLLEETDWPSKYVELPNAGHWFNWCDDNLTAKFYENSLHFNKTALTFPIYLQSPDRFGRMHVKIDVQKETWPIQTQIIHRFCVPAKACNGEKRIVLILDGTDTNFRVDPAQCEFNWSKESGWQSLSQMYGRQVNAKDADSCPSGTFSINTCSANAVEMALQISRNLLQYFAADSSIERHCGSLAAGCPGNAIFVSLGNELPALVSSSYPVPVADARIILYSCFPVPGGLDGPTDPASSKNFGQHTVKHEPAMGALFPRPPSWLCGVPFDCLQALRLVPTLTGAGQPDFMVLGGSCPGRAMRDAMLLATLTGSGKISAAFYTANDV